MSKKVQIITYIILDKTALKTLSATLSGRLCVKTTRKKAQRRKLNTGNIINWWKSHLCLLMMALKTLPSFQHVWKLFTFMSSSSTCFCAHMSRPAFADNSFPSSSVTTMSSICNFFFVKKWLLTNDLNELVSFRSENNTRFFWSCTSFSNKYYFKQV